MINYRARNVKFASRMKLRQKRFAMTENRPKTRISKLQIAGIVLTTLGLALFVFFVYTAGIEEIWGGISRLGLGFLFVLALYAVKVTTRVYAWTLCVEKPYHLRFVDAFRAVMIGEALSAMIPLGILMSGTAKAVAVRKRVPLVVGLSSIAIENLFYSLATGTLIVCGSIAFLLTFHPAGNVATVGYAIIAIITTLTIGGFFMVIQEWRFASWLAEWLYGKGLATRVLRHGRVEVERFEDLIYGFYRKHPRKFLPLVLLETAFHAVGVFEVWFILRAVMDVAPNFLTAFLLETINRAILVVFKLVPFLVGVDEAGAQFISDALALGAAVGVTLAIVRKGRVLFWTGLGVILIVRSGLSFREVSAETFSAQKSEA
ncbi:MAG TPA: lysylphosphatidylglycerol synthase transmembrane domain-containing protein [Pyrinomonadaceae bacterium]